MNTVDDTLAAKPRCVIFAVYFGQLPSYFDVFLRSVELNAEIDFLLVTDQTIAWKPNNLQVEQMDLDEFSEMSSKALGMPVVMPRPYKVCDFRPAFGHIFESYIQGYSHWGHCDLDVIFGDILGVIPQEAFSSYAKILIRGNFAIYQNTPAANAWYRTVLPDVDYRRVFSTPNPFHFDESAGILRILRHLDVSIWNEECIFNIEWEQFRMRAVGSAPGYHSYVWRNGRILEYSGASGSKILVREGLLIHLMKRQMAAPQFDVRNAEQIAIGPDRFYPYQEPALPTRPFNWDFMLAWSGARHHFRRLKRRFSKRGDLRPLA
ncbi:hypothetical protein JOE31_001328 [Arthrobacter sp. PvP023]|uniref:DUF6625 family protein n=1 Tax=Micrococcaceae TaxID=1268 RepID=UPI001AE69605|nr:DUF6625 family protein [Arthrobacter sp. PvP023]MBP1135096.1 hypothetical protein [Arthrobacter sp. PvP023]